MSSAGKSGLKKHTNRYAKLVLASAATANGILLRGFKVSGPTYHGK